MILRSRSLQSAVKRNASCSDLPRLCSQPKFSNRCGLEPSPLPFQFLNWVVLLSKLEAHFHRIRRRRRKKRAAAVLLAQTLSRNVCWKVGSYGNVTAPQLLDKYAQGLGVGGWRQLGTIWAAELEVRETVQLKPSHV